MNQILCMRTFVQVVEAGSFAAVADAIGVTGPMVGRQVRWLEDHLGAQLLTRTTRRQSLTEAGKIYFERSKVVLAELAAADDSVALMRSIPRGLLRIDAPVTFGTCCLAPVLPAYLAANPEVRVELTLNNRIVDLVEEGYDAVIRIGELPDSGLIARKLMPYRLVACAAPAYLQQRGRPTAPADLATHACLGFHPGAPRDSWTFVDSKGQIINVKVSGPLIANNGDVLLSAALSGVGIMLQPEVLVVEDLEAGRLVPVLDGFTPRAQPIHALYAITRPPPPKLTSFISFLSSSFA